MKFLLSDTTATESPKLLKVLGFSFWAKKAPPIKMGGLLNNLLNRHKNKAISDDLPKTIQHHVFTPDARKRAVMISQQKGFILLAGCTVGLLYVQSEHGVLKINQL